MRQHMSRARRSFIIAVIGVLGLSLGACNTSRFSYSGGPRDGNNAGTGDIYEPGATGEGVVKVALLLPLSARGRFGEIAKSLKNAAELALFESGQNQVLLIPKDTFGTPAGAGKAAREALEDGAEIILGPFLAGSVAAAGAVSRPQNVPVIGFSTTTKVAGNGVYLISRPPQEEVLRIVDFTVRRGKTRFGALIPNGSYGDVVAEAFRSAVQQRGGQVVAIERYQQSSAGMTEPAARISRLARGADRRIDAILLAEGDPHLRSLAPLLAHNSVDMRQVKLIGTGLWDGAGSAREPALRGGWFAGVKPAARRKFERRYNQVYGGNPVPISSLAYDAVNMAARLAAAPKGQRFTRERLEDPNGFSGVNGDFRFRADGTPERGLAILEITSTGFRVISSGSGQFGARAEY